MTSDLISRSALLERLAFKRMGSMRRNTYPGLESAIAQAKKAPAVDAVEVVRCKDCKHWKKDVPGCTDFVGRCGLANYMIGATGYCVYAERKAEEK